MSSQRPDKFDRGILQYCVLKKRN